LEDVIGDMKGTAEAADMAGVEVIMNMVEDTTGVEAAGTTTTIIRSEEEQIRCFAGSDSDGGCGSFQAAGVPALRRLYLFIRNSCHKNDDTPM
jgi:hypothetical protein